MKENRQRRSAVRQIGSKLTSSKSGMLLTRRRGRYVEAADGSSERLYLGGSGGAFEACATLREGAVIAIMNARILKPFQVSTLRVLQ